MQIKCQFEGVSIFFPNISSAHWWYQFDLKRVFGSEWSDVYACTYFFQCHDNEILMTDQLLCCLFPFYLFSFLSSRSQCFLCSQCIWCYWDLRVLGSWKSCGKYPCPKTDAVRWSWLFNIIYHFPIFYCTILVLTIPSIHIQVYIWLVKEGSRGTHRHSQDWRYQLVQNVFATIISEVSETRSSGVGLQHWYESGWNIRQVCAGHRGRYSV